MQACSTCGERNSDQARYCQNCAAPLGGISAVGESRKVVTILFSDVVDSTSLAEDLDPESLRIVMGRFFDAVRTSVRRHGGTVEKYIGDAAMAVFGIPIVHEDDALRACRAAVEMKERVDRLNEELEREFGVRIATRTGVNTGDVVAGAPASGQTLVTGDAVNTAARLEQSAPAGAILVGGRTYRLVRDAVTVEPVEPIAAKGKAEAVHAYRLISVAPETWERVRPFASPLVGRDSELRLLHEELERSVASRRCIVATVVGQPGVGKSRLIHEFTAGIGDETILLRGRCLPYGEGITFWPVTEMIRQAAAITDDMSADEAMARLEEFLPGGDTRTAIRDGVAAVLGLMEGTRGIQETFWAIRKVLEEQASERPLVVVFEDIHWAEPTFLDLIEYLEERIKGSAVLLLCLARSELLDSRPGWAKGSSRSVTIMLEPLTREQSDRLIENLLGVGSLPDAVERSIADMAEGNPLFVEEILGMLIDEQRLLRNNGGWVAAGDLSSVVPPPSVQGVLAARIERLPDEQRAILQRASVAGSVFWWGAVADLAPPHEREHVGSHLQTMVRSGLIVPEESTFAGQDAFKFRHILIRDAAYGSLPRIARSELHERFADWMQRAIGDRADEYEEILGYHLEQACRQKLSTTGTHERQLAIRASKLLASAGRRAFDRDDIKAALNLLSRASQLCPVDESEHLAIQLLLADCLWLAGEPGRADDVLSEVEQRAATVGDRAAEWQARIQRGEILAGTTSFSGEEQRGTIDRALEVFAELGYERGLSKAWDLLAFLHFNAGRIQEAGGASAKAATHAGSAGDTAQESWGMVSVVQYAAIGVTPVESALDLCRSTLDLMRGQMGQEAALLIQLGRLEAMNGNVGPAREAIAHARSILEDVGATHPLASTTEAAAEVAWYAEDFPRQERECRSGYDAFREMDAKGWEATWAALLARSLVELGRDDEAFELSLESQRLAAADDITAQVPWRRARARVLARRGEDETAELLAREAVSIADGTDWLNARGEAHMDLAEVLLALDRPHEAAEEFRVAWGLFEAKGNVVATGWARAALDQLSESPPA